MANITMAKSTSRPICRSGAIALIIDLSTTWRPVWKKFDRSNSGPTTAPSKRLFTLFLLVSRLFTFPRCSGKRACRTVFSFLFFLFSFFFSFFSRSEAPETKSTLDYRVQTKAFVLSIRGSTAAKQLRYFVLVTWTQHTTLKRYSYLGGAT